MFLEPKEFAKAVGVPYTTLRVHIGRKKVFKSGGFINTDHAINKNYINEKTYHKGLDLSKIGQEEKKEKRTKAKSKPKPKNPPIQEKEVEEPTSPPDDGMTREEIIDHSLTLRKKRADAEKAERDNELKKIEIQKRLGELLPIELVDKILTINIQSVFRSFESLADNVGSVYCEILGGDRSHLSEMSQQMRIELQKKIEEVKNKSSEEVNQAIKEYAEVRGRGQRK